MRVVYIFLCIALGTSILAAGERRGFSMAEVDTTRLQHRISFDYAQVPFLDYAAQVELTLLVPDSLMKKRIEQDSLFIAMAVHRQLEKVTDRDPSVQAIEKALYEDILGFFSLRRRFHLHLFIRELDPLPSQE
ncbi:hypothetical protein [Chitinivibrio alkaliphilus]|uniref:Uncharacterized protein n=1 Tax=Chitinivibrio alkaliphilus ACht1 TaxID=1313304 RepID=U7DAW2_9BACT|nr:hypothetical protein [Chitinivibrio alkaliphilus]ERP39167.1 hypothetical protein CALK_0337 [Chitinivibrio alkaliphilus ACht1]